MAAQVQPPTSRRPLQDEDLLISVSGGLGRFDEDANVYRKDADCLECLKDLQRFLRRDDPYTRDVFHRLCQWDLVATDLVPLVVQYQDDSDVVYNALKVLTFLTMPVDPESDDLHVQCRELARIKEIRPDSPILVSEFWPGWFDHWFEPNHNILSEEDFR